MTTIPSHIDSDVREPVNPLATVWPYFSRKYDIRCIKESSPTWFSFADVRSRICACQVVPCYIHFCTILCRSQPVIRFASSPSCEVCTGSIYPQPVGLIRRIPVQTNPVCNPNCLWDKCLIFSLWIDRHKIGSQSLTCCFGWVPIEWRRGEHVAGTIEVDPVVRTCH